MESEYLAGVEVVALNGSVVLTVGVSKVGGGTLGNDYTGTWDVTVREKGKAADWCEVITTGTPKNHVDVALMAADFYTDQMEAPSE